MAKVGRKKFGFYPDEAAIIKVIKLKCRCRKGQEGGLVNVERGKGFKKRSVFIAPELADFIRNYIRTYRDGVSRGHLYSSG